MNTNQLGNEYLQLGTRLFCSSSLLLVASLSMGEIQDSCTVIKVYCHDRVSNPRFADQIHQHLSGVFHSAHDMLPLEW